MKKPNPMAKDLRQPKYRSKVVPDKKKPKLYRKAKHKKGPLRGLSFYVSSKCGASMNGLLP
mgnify:FL=1|jgi:hypothetical protein